VVFSWDLKDTAESIERRLGLSEFQTDGTETETARGAKLELTDGLTPLMGPRNCMTPICVQKLQMNILVLTKEPNSLLPGIFLYCKIYQNAFTAGCSIRAPLHGEAHSAGLSRPPIAEFVSHLLVETGLG